MNSIKRSCSEIRIPHSHPAGSFIARIKMNCQISGQRADHLAATLFRRHLADAGRHKVFGLDLFFACKKMQDARADYLLLVK